MKVAVVMLALLALLALPALAADDETIAAQNTFFDPSSVTINVGDTVTLDNIGGTHNFHFSDGQQLPAMPTTNTDAVWNTPLTKTFDVPGTYSFHCDQHATMTGTITVVDPNATPTPTPTPSATPPPTPQPTPGLKIRRLRIRAAAFCSRRSRACKRPGVAIRIDLTAPAHVRGKLKRGRRAAGKVDLGTVRAGARTLRFGRRLKPSRYTLRLRVGTLPARTLKFRVRA